jgi:hypothetical protein
MKSELKYIITQFGFSPETCSIEPFGTGHIHDTYRVDHQREGEPPLILQRMNHFVFKNIPLLMRNMELVTENIVQKNELAGLSAKENGIVLYHTPEGKSWVGDEDLGYWRMMYLIEDQIAFEIAEDADIAFGGGVAIAKFQSQLTDLDPEKMHDTIPEFLYLKGRLKQFVESLEGASQERLNKAGELIKIADEHARAAIEVYDISENGDVPVRITHNDTKFNNILYNKKRKVTCIIDLDTVMKGYAWYDFGDALRTCASKAAEDEPDVSKIGFDIDIFKGFAQGYLSVARDFLTKDEISLLHRAPGVFTYMQGIRFLTDYLNNDVYYKTSHKEHNFERARAQFALMKCQLNQQAMMEEIVKEETTSFPSSTSTQK